MLVRFSVYEGDSRQRPAAPSPPNRRSSEKPDRLERFQIFDQLFPLIVGEFAGVVMAQIRITGEGGIEVEITLVGAKADVDGIELATADPKRLNAFCGGFQQLVETGDRPVV